MHPYYTRTRYMESTGATSAEDLAETGQAAFSRLEAIHHEMAAIQRLVFTRGPMFQSDWDQLVRERARLEEELFALARHKWAGQAGSQCNTLHAPSASADAAMHGQLEMAAGRASASVF